MSRAGKKFFYNREDIIPLVNKWRQAGDTIGFTSGGFDILHFGHVDYLGKSSRLCDRLVVGVNSDKSVRLTKGWKRPLVGEKDRARIISSLENVSGAFLFTEANNRENILSLKPDFYFKGGDYRLSDLSSADLLKAWGGKVKTIPFVKNRSTSGLIQKVLTRYHDELPRMIPLPKKKPVPAVFLDRDGVINREVEYLNDPKDFTFTTGAIAGLKHFQSLGYRLIIVTNQAGIGLGYFSKEDFFRVNKKMLGMCRQNGIIISKVYYCPHGLEDNCLCRKPGTLLLERASEEGDIDLAKSIMVGDKTSDIICGQSLGLTTIMVRTGHGGKDGEYQVTPDATVKDLREAARWTEKIRDS